MNQTNKLPIYLQHKLSLFNISSIPELKQANYFKVFAWLKDVYPSTSFKTLWDLYCLTNNKQINSLNELEKKQILNQYKAMLPCYFPLSEKLIDYYLGLAQNQAKIALMNDEIPIGAVIVKNDEVIAAGYNQSLKKNSSIYHAELIAIKEAQKALNSTYLSECDLYVSLEPCVMCSGAIINSRIKRVIFGALEPKTGACLSQFEIFTNKLVNHHTQVIGPIDNSKYSSLLKQFLAQKR